MSVKEAILSWVRPKPPVIVIRIPTQSGSISTWYEQEYRFVSHHAESANALSVHEESALTDRHILRTKISKHFSKQALRDLCFDMRIDDENLTTTNKADLIRELILFCERNGRIEELLRMCRQIFPKVNWN